MIERHQFKWRVTTLVAERYMGAIPKSTQASQPKRFNLYTQPTYQYLAEAKHMSDEESAFEDEQGQTVEVSGVNAHTQLEDVQAFFQNKKRGGLIEKISLDPLNNTYIIRFKDKACMYTV